MARIAWLIVALTWTACGRSQAPPAREGASAESPSGDHVASLDHPDENAEASLQFRPPRRVFVADVTPVCTVDGAGRFTGDLRDIIRIGQRLFVLDDDSRVHAFSLPRCSHIGTFGGRGEGPGEFRRAWLLSDTEDGNLLVYDALGPRIVVLTAEGEEIRRVRARANRGVVSGFPRVALGYVLITENIMPGETRAERAEIIDTEGSVLRPLIETTLRQSHVVNNPDPTTNPIFSMLYTPYRQRLASAGLANGEFVVARSDDYRIFLYDKDGRHVRTVQMLEEPTPFPADEIDRITERSPTWVRSALEKETAPLLDRAVPLHADFAVLLFQAERVSTLFDVFTSDAEYVGRWSAPGIVIDGDERYWYAVSDGETYQVTVLDVGTRSTTRFP